MNGSSYAGTTIVPPGGMYVRALYDYDADDQTSLSFRQGEVIQVITQLESGWWDGVINGVRGWFPSNYCAVVPRAAAVHDGHHDAGHPPPADETDDEAEIREEIDDNDEYEAAERETGFGHGDLPPDHHAAAHAAAAASPRDEEAAFWIPQAMSDGRLFYFNTLTGQSRLELPLEAPTSGSETGPRDRSNVSIPDNVRPSVELTSGAYDRGYESGFDQSASEAEGQPDRRQRELNGVSPATSNDSLNRPRSPTKPRTSGATKQQVTSMTSFTTGSFGGAGQPLISRRFFDDVQPVAMSWDRLVDDMRRSVERYRQAIHAGDKSDFVRRVEDISDHLRLLFAAGSGTTDNHSGNPSIINSNRSLYPHFRETMSRFSKLVLSSHIAAADWPPQDSFAKCLRESEGVLNGMYGFVDVARRQRGEDIPRVVPGFLVNSYTGGSWQNNGVLVQDSPVPPPLADLDDHEPLVEPVRRLDAKMLQKLEDSKSLVISSLRDLESHLHIRDRLITPLKHRAIADAICRSAKVVLDRYAPWIQSVESVNLSALSSGFPSAQLQDLNVAKQTVYDSVSDLILACQAVAAPLGDEWSETRNDSLEDRVTLVRSLSKSLEHCTSQVYYSLQLLSESVPAAEANQSALGRNGAGAGASASAVDHGRTRSTASGKTLASEPRSPVERAPASFGNGDGHETKRSTFGEMPLASPLGEETPEFLTLDHEGELSYDHKVSPPSLRGGTLAALVEQLTRHDRLDSDFNNTFLLTYQSFTTGQELFEMLVRRWKMEPRQGLAPDEYQVWADKKQKPIRFRVVNILKSWFDSYWMEGDSDDAKALILQVSNFAREHVANTNTPGAAPLLQAIDQRARAPGQDSARKQLVLTLNTSTPQPILPKNMKKLKFLDIDETEFARQLTIIESKLYGKIRPTECLNKTWQRKVTPGDPEPAKNVRDLILHSNQLTNWVAQMILAQPQVKNRVVVIKRFVTVADRCRQLNNFSTLTSIISALGTAPIHRLTRTWAGVNSKVMATLEAMRKLMGSTKNFLEYRDTLAKANPPCIPFFGVYLTDLTFIEDGIPSIIKKTNLINFAKRAKTAEVIRGIQQYQNVPYSLQPVPELQDYILNNMRSAGDVHEMYDMSLRVEPREREDEKIARLLAESGFL